MKGVLENILKNPKLKLVRSSEIDPLYEPFNINGTSYHCFSSGRGSMRSLTLISGNLAKLKPDSNWLFLVGGYDGLNSKKVLADEVGYLTKIAEEKEIKLLDPLVSLTNSDFIESNISDKMCQDAAYGAIMRNYCNGMIESEAFMDYNFNLGSIKVQELWHYLRVTPETIVQRNFERLKEESLSLSREKSADILKDSSQKNILIYVDDIYKELIDDLKSIS